MQSLIATPFERFAVLAAKLIAEADVIAPATPSTAACSASALMFTNLGNAVAARIPRITITTISSISVNPVCSGIRHVTLRWLKSDSRSTLSNFTSPNT